LSDDPFFQAPLAPSEDADYPISLFVGRDLDLRLLGGQIVGSGSSRAIVQGAAGVGKTSFVNRLKVAVADHRVLTHEEPVRMRRGMSARQFCAEVLRVLLQIRGTMSARSVTGDATFWRRVGRVVEGEDSVAAGLTVAGVGAQRELVRIPSEVSELSLIDDVAEAIGLLAGRNGRRVLLHVNNLENLSRDDARAAAGLLQDVRDVFLAGRGHWLFVGAEDIEQTVFRTAAQLGGIVPLAATLAPLAPAEVIELLTRRYEHLRRGVRFTPPVEPEGAAALYERYRGDLRNFLRLLSRGVQRHAVTSPGESLTTRSVIVLMAPTYRSELLARIGASDASYLATVYRDRHASDEFRVTEVVAHTSLTQAAASKFAQRLVAAGVIEQSRTAGKSIYYRLRGGDVSVALGLTD
jgi:hypothetical protein